MICRFGDTDEVGRVSSSPCTALSLPALRINTLTPRTIKYLNASTAEALSNLAVAVPSRLYYPAKSDKPLNGLRVATKDNIDIAGVKTFGSSRAL